jgi:hypothetical protein
MGIAVHPAALPVVSLRFSSFRPGIMLEFNALSRSIKEMQGRLDALRGYL